MAIDFVGTQINTLTSWVNSWFQNNPKEKEVQTDSCLITPISSLFNWIFWTSSHSNQSPSPNISKNFKVKQVRKSEKDSQVNRTYTSQIVTSISSLFNWIFYPLRFLHFTKSSPSQLRQSSSNTPQLSNKEFIDIANNDEENTLFLQEWVVEPKIEDTFKYEIHNMGPFIIG